MVAILREADRSSVAETDTLKRLVAEDVMAIDTPKEINRRKW